MQRLVAAGHDTLILIVTSIFELETNDRRVERLLRMHPASAGVPSAHYGCGTSRWYAAVTVRPFAAVPFTVVV